MKLVQFIEKSLGFLTQKNLQSLSGARNIQDEMYSTSQFPSDCGRNRIIWVDMEMTGLDPDKDHILEVACVVTNEQLDTLGETSFIVHQPESVLLNMNDWCLKHHWGSGLIDASLKSTVTVQDAEQQLLCFVKKYAPAGKCPLAGNSVYMDKFFLLKHMPTFAKFLHYRIIDVSSVKELARRWFSFEFPEKQMKHRALEDVTESIKELRYYKRHIFQK